MLAVLLLFFFFFKPEVLLALALMHVTVSELLPASGLDSPALALFPIQLTDREPIDVSAAVQRKVDTLMKLCSNTSI